MDYRGRINRRDFIKSSVLTGGALMAQSVMPAGAVALMQGQGSNEAGAPRATVCSRASATYTCIAGPTLASGRQMSLA